jgi:hypothetical protein
VRHALFAGFRYPVPVRSPVRCGVRVLERGNP